MRKKSKKYSLVPSFKVNAKSGVSIYRVLRDEASFTDLLVDKYEKDVKELLNAKLERLTHVYKVPEKEIKRIKELISEVEKVSAIKC